jgi:hypothetical protein
LTFLGVAHPPAHTSAPGAAPAIAAMRVAYSGRMQAQSTCTPPIIISPTRPMKADGVDWAEITIVQPVTEDTAFYLSTTLGTLRPNPVSIEAGGAVGKGAITSETVGEATISCVRSVPRVPTEATRPVTVHFKPPVTGFDLRVDPPRMPWVDRADIVVTLLRDDETPVRTDETRVVTLHRDSGSGDIQPTELKIERDEFQGRATFTPYQTGHVRVAATTPDFARVAVDIEVTSLPYLMFMLPVLGGICGGVVAWTRRPGAAPSAGDAPGSRRRIPRGLILRAGIGLLAGTILHWSFVFDLLPLQRTVVMNQFSWFVLPAIGGWLGTKVFDVVLRPVGVASSP